MWFILVGIIAVALLILFYKWAVKNDDFFKDKGVAFMKPVRKFSAAHENYNKILDIFDRKFWRFAVEK